MVLSDINLENIHMYGMQLKSAKELKSLSEDPRNLIAEYLIRRLYNLH